MFKSAKAKFQYKTIGGVGIMMMTYDYSLDRETQFMVVDGDISFLFYKQDWGSNRNAFQAARDWRNGGYRLNLCHGISVEKLGKAGYIVKPTYIN